MGLPRHEYWSGLPFPFPRDLPDPGIEPMSLASPALADGFFITSTTGKPPPSLYLQVSFGYYEILLRE